MNAGRLHMNLYMYNLWDIRVLLNCTSAKKMKLNQQMVVIVKNVSANLMGIYFLDMWS